MHLHTNRNEIKSKTIMKISDICHSNQIHQAIEQPEINRRTK